MHYPIIIVDVRLSAANISQLVLGVILLCVAIAGCVIIVVVQVKSVSRGVGSRGAPCAGAPPILRQK